MTALWPRPKPATVKKEVGYTWERSRAYVLASPSCQACRGTGLKNVLATRLQPCGCVLRAIYNACYGRYRSIGDEQGSEGTKASMMRSGGRSRSRPLAWSRPREEFRADFILMARRTLNAEDYRLFDLHFVRERDWTKCAALLGLNRGNFYHGVYRVEEKLGRAFIETRPYGLYPLHEYMAHTERGGMGAEMASVILQPKLTGFQHHGDRRADTMGDTPPAAMSMAAA